MIDIKFIFQVITYWPSYRTEVKAVLVTAFAIAPYTADLDPVTGPILNHLINNTIVYNQTMIKQASKMCSVVSEQQTF